MRVSKLFCALVAGVPSALSLGSSIAQGATLGYTDLYKIGVPAFYAGGGLQFAYKPGAGGQFAGTIGLSTLNPQALMWSPQFPSGVSLVPAGSKASVAEGTDGVHQVGYAVVAADGLYHALLWSGQADAFVDLHPSFAGSGGSFANGVRGSQQVGSFFADIDGQHAVLWSGSAASAVDLNPAGYYSIAYATDGTQQVGYGSQAGVIGATHALLWSGSASSYVDLNPAAGTQSYAFGVGGGQQVGYAFSVGGTDHAALWSGSAASFVDLSPALPAGGSAQAWDTNGTFQVGVVDNHATLWSGSAASAIDLQAVLPSSFTSSIAYAIDGDTVYGTATGRDGTHAIAWSVPEPTGGVALLAVAGVVTLRRRRRSA
jgi:hypothetical protein